MRSLFRLTCFALALFAILPVQADGGQAVQDRLNEDLKNGRPAVVHLVVALCDNENQGIVPVPKALGNGQDPKSNLYWGALYGVKTFLPRKGGWKVLDVEKPANEHILARTIFHAKIKRDGKAVPVYIVADAWDGARMREALEHYLSMASGRAQEQVDTPGEAEPFTLSAGGDAQLLAFVGHNGLMDFSLTPPPPAAADARARGAIVLACASKGYFTPHFAAVGTQPILLTTGLMAPEAYTLDGAIRAWVSDGTTEAVNEAAAQAYNTYQKCGLKGARRLFWGAP